MDDKVNEEREEQEFYERKARETAERQTALDWKGESRSVSISDTVAIDLRSVPGSLWFGKTEVTKAQWGAVMGDNPSRYRYNPDNPVENVSWSDCQEFLERLNLCSSVKASGLTFRLPTEDEWERACRAGATGDYCLLADGTEITEDMLDQVAWFDDNSGRRTHPVGQKQPNAFGLYDMHGNVWEWTSTGFGGEAFVSRGGSWDRTAWECRSASLFADRPSSRYDILGFRLCADAKTIDGVSATMSEPGGGGMIDVDAKTDAERKAREEREAEELFTKREREIGKKRADARKELDAILEIQDDVRNASGWQGAYLVSEYCKALGVRFDEDDPEGTGFRLGKRLKEEEKKFRAMLDEADRELEQLEASMPPALAERLAAERKAREEREAAERRAKEEREAAERKAREEREAAERRAKAEREAAERKAREEREAAERKAREEHEAAIRDRMNRWTRGDLEPKERSAVESILSDMVAVPGKRFKLGKREVTRTQWEGVVGTPCPALTDCSKLGEADGPAAPASRNEIREFLAILNSCPAVRNARLEFRLPTDDELRSVRDAQTVGRPARGASEPAFAGAGFDGFEPDREMTEKEKRIAEAAECKAKEKKAAEAVRSILESMVEVPREGFRIGRYEVTQSQWEALMGENPSSSKGADLPVENVSWRDCQRFLKALNAHPLSKRSFTVFRIPESWEWSKAARAGREDPYCLLADGSIITKDCLGEIAWFDENSDAKTHPVGQKGANAYGLYDLYGNVREWTRAPSQDFTWMSTRPIATGRSDVYGVCGGGMNSTSEACKGLEERFSSDDVREPDIGLRLCCDARTILYVDAEKGDDANPGTSRDRPKKTIQAAIDAPSAPAEITRGVTILVADGVYGPIVSHNKDVAIVGENGPEKCIVDGGGTRRCANLTSFGEKFSLPAGGLFGWSELDRVNYAKEANNSRRTRLVGLTLQNGCCDARYELAHGAGILGGRSEGCIVQDCKTKGQGAGIAFGEHDRAIVRRCSQASGSSVGVALTGGWGSLPVFRNCLVYECGAGANEPNRGNLVNECIIYNCTIDGSDLGSDYPVVDTGEAYNSILLGSDLHAGRILKIYNCAYDGKRGSALSYGSEQFRNFKFLDVEKRDYRLAPGSPCIDAGDSAKIESETDLAGNARVQGGSVDIGCYEATPE